MPDLIYEETGDGDIDIDNVYRILTDEGGSVRMVIQLNAVPNPIVVQRIEYDVFGNPTFVVGGETVQPFGYAGAIWLGHPRFWHMGVRDYDPAVGRWTSKDPLRFAGGTNLYAYCEGDPVNSIDVTGRNPVLFVAAAVVIGVVTYLVINELRGRESTVPGAVGAGLGFGAGAIPGVHPLLAIPLSGAGGWAGEEIGEGIDDGIEHLREVREFGEESRRHQFRGDYSDGTCWQEPHDPDDQYRYPQWMDPGPPLDPIRGGPR